MIWINRTRLLAACNAAVCLLGAAIGLWGWWV